MHVQKSVGDFQQGQSFDELPCDRSTLHSHANCCVCGQKVCDLMELFLKISEREKKRESLCVLVHLYCGVISMAYKHGISLFTTILISYVGSNMYDVQVGH